MLTLPEEFSRQISGFAPLFSKSVFENAKTLLLGAILSLGRRTVCACLRSVGLSQEQRFHKYHWVLSLAEWCPRQAAQVLIRLLISTFEKLSRKSHILSDPGKVRAGIGWVNRTELSTFLKIAHEHILRQILPD